jgi:hypothetical protein
MKIMLACLCLLLLPTLASAGILWGDNVTITNYGAADGYSVRYSRSYSSPISYRTYRVYRGDVQSGYYVPAPAASVDVVQEAPVVVYAAPQRVAVHVVRHRVKVKHHVHHVRVRSSASICP